MSAHRRDSWLAVTLTAPRCERCPAEASATQLGGPIARRAPRGVSAVLQATRSSWSSDLSGVRAVNGQRRGQQFGNEDVGESLARNTRRGGGHVDRGNRVAVGVYRDRAREQSLLVLIDRNREAVGPDRVEHGRELAPPACGEMRHRRGGGRNDPAPGGLRGGGRPPTISCWPLGRASC